MEEVFRSSADHLQLIISNIPDSKREKELLYLYARYKQATVGKCNEPRPSFINFGAKRKWNAWNELKDLDREIAMREYVEKIKELDPSWNELKSKQSQGTGMGVAVSVPKCDEVEIEDSVKDVFDWCREGNLEKVELVWTGDFPADEEKRTLLHWACDRNHLNIAEFLINKGHDLDCRDTDNSTPLHYASSCGHSEIVRLLLTRNADPNLLDSDGESPKLCSADKNIRKIFEEFE